MDLTNPAVTAHTNINPALLELVQSDPEVLRKISRSELLVQIHLLRQYESISFQQRLQFGEFLAKLGDAYPKANVGMSAAERVTLVFNMGDGESRTFGPPVIDVAATTLVEPSAPTDGNTDLQPD